MTAIVRRATRTSPAANTRLNLYTVPTGKSAVLRTLTMAHDLGSTTQMGAELNGAGFLWSVQVPQIDSKVWPLSTVMTAGQTINIESAGVSTYYLLQYVEMDATAEGVNLWTHYASNVQAATVTYTVPAGKRVRVREMVICPHGSSSGSFSSAISGQGYLARGLFAGQNIVIGMDMSVNAGEVISSSAVTATTHIFYSGVIEDA